MADPEVHISTGETGANDTVGDIDMGGEEGAESVQVEETAAAANEGNAAEASQEQSSPPRTTFIEYVLDSTTPAPLLIKIGKLPKIPHHRASRRNRRRPNPPHGTPSTPHPKPLFRRRSDPIRRKR